jgi:hypothetical protein
MASIPLPALGVHAPDPMEGMQRMAQLKQLMNEQALQPGRVQAQQLQIQNQKAELAQVQENQRQNRVLNDAVQKYTKTDSEGRSTTDHDAVLNYMAENGAGKDLISYRTNLAAMNKEQRAAEAERLKMVGAKLDAATKFVSTANDPQSWEQARRHVAQEISPDLAKQMGDFSPQQKEQVLQWGMNASDHAGYMLKMAETEKNKAETNKINTEMNLFTGPMAEGRYRFVLQKIAAKQPVSPDDMNFAHSYEAANKKTSTASDSLGVTSNTTSGPAGLAAIGAGRQAIAMPNAGGGQSAGASRPAGAPVAKPQGAKADLVDMIGQYKLNPSQMARLTAKHPDVLAAVNAKYPDWSQSNYNAANKAITDLAPSGKTGQQITSYNTFLRHAGALYDAVDSLDNSKYSDLLNKPVNWLAQHTGDPRVADFMAAMQPPMKEFQSFLLNNHAMHEEDVKDAHSLIDVNKTPQEIRAVLKRFAETGSARLSEQNESFKRVTGRDIPNLVSPQAAAAYNKIAGQGGSTKTISMSQIQQAAKDHGVSVDEAKRQAEAAGYKIQ